MPKRKDCSNRKKDEKMSEKGRLDDILDGMLAEFGAPTADAISATSRRFPEYRAMLLEFAASWAEEVHLPEPVETGSTSEIALVNARGEFAARLAARTQPATLAALAGAVGRTLQDIADRCRFSVIVARKLDAGVIDPSSVGEILPRKIAGLLGVTREAVLAALAGPPSPALAAAFMPMDLPKERLEAALNAADTDQAVIDELELAGGPQG